MKRGQFVIALMLVLLMLAGCTQNQVLMTLQVAVDAASVAVAVLGSTSIPAPVAASLEAYLQAVNSGLAQASAILNDTQLTPAEQAVQITALFAGLALPYMPSGTPLVIVNAIDAVAKALANFLASLPPAQKLLRTAKVHEVKWSGSERDKLLRIRIEAQTNIAALLSMKR